MRCAWLLASALLVASTLARADDPASWGSIDTRLTPAEVLGPLGWADLCRQQPAQCAPATGEPVVSLGERSYAALLTSFQAVKAAIRPATEPSGQNEWRIEPRSGDCEDMALTLRARLEAQGWPAAALRLALARTERGESHVALLLETLRGTVVLDSRFDRPLAWVDLEHRGYTWMAVERRDGRGRWQLADHAFVATPAATSSP